MPRTDILLRNISIVDVPTVVSAWMDWGTGLHVFVNKAGPVQHVQRTWMNVR